jgi:type I restriction enzyme R subunit
MYPNKYKSDFAMQVSSDVDGSQQNTINFSNNNLSGKTNFLEGYKSSKTRVCITVGMMTTGYDCQDLLNIGLFRPIFSPSDFIQIKGRGTRKYTFKYKFKNDFGEMIEKSIEKNKFKLFDFFGNCEYFEKDFPYDEQIKLPAISATYEDDGREKPMVLREGFENYNVDNIKTFNELEVGKEGMRIDRELFENFKSDIKNNSIIKEKYEKGFIEEAIEFVKKELFNKPEEYINLEKLSKAIKLDRRLSMRELLAMIFENIIPKKKNDLLDDELSKFIDLNTENKHKTSLEDSIHLIKRFMREYIQNATFRTIIDEGNFTELETNPVFSMKDLEELDGWRDDLVNYIKDYVNLKSFEGVA